MWTRPWHLTLWDYLALGEVERIDGFLTDAVGIQSAVRHAMATHDPKLLQDEHRALVLRCRQDAPDTVTATARERAQALIARLQKGRVLDGN